MRLIKRVLPKTFLAINKSNAIHVNFEPFIEHYRLEGSYILLHWNRLFKQYGFYSSVDDNYFTHSAGHTLITTFGELGEIFPDKPILPTACLIYRDSEVVFHNKTLNIQSIYNG